MERILVAAGPWPPADVALAADSKHVGVRCVHAADVALAAIREASPAALLVDAALEGAAELMASVRHSHDLDLLPVLVAIATPTDADAVRAYTIGGDDFVLASELATQLAPKLDAALAESEL